MSDVVTTVLIVLLALGAIAIVAGFVLPMIREGSAQISGACQQIDLDATKCEANTSSSKTSVFVKRGPGDTELTGINVIITHDDDTTSVDKKETLLPNVLETKSYDIETGADTGNVKKVQLAAVVLTEAGDPKDCPVISSQDCMQVT